MNTLQTNIFESMSVPQWWSFQLIDVFDKPGKKTITLQSHTSLIYLVVGYDADIHIDINTEGMHCSCKVFWLFISDAEHAASGSLKLVLNHSYTSADVEIISFLYDGAKVAINVSIDIWTHLDQVHGRLLEQNIVVGKDISLRTLPKLTVASHNVRAAHGANIDTLDPQKLFYMMSRGLTQAQSQTLLVDWYIDYVLSHFDTVGDIDKDTLRAFLHK